MVRDTGRDGTDERFAAMYTDPRFQRFPKSKKTVQIDNRFAAMFQDPDFQIRTKVDKRGRKLVQRKSEDMRRYYRLGEEDKGRQMKASDPLSISRMRRSSALERAND